MKRHSPHERPVVAQRGRFNSFLLQPGKDEPVDVVSDGSARLDVGDFNLRAGASDLLSNRVTLVPVMAFLFASFLPTSLVDEDVIVSALTFEGFPASVCHWDVEFRTQHSERCAAIF